MKCDDCIGKGICSFDGGDDCTTFLKLVEEKFTSTNTQSMQCTGRCGMKIDELIEDMHDICQLIDGWTGGNCSCGAPVPWSDFDEATKRKAHKLLAAFLISKSVEFSAEYCGDTSSISNNSDYATALRVWKEFVSNAGPCTTIGPFDIWVKQRLNSTKESNCA